MHLTAEKTRTETLSSKLEESRRDVEALKAALDNPSMHLARHSDADYAELKKYVQISRYLDDTQLL